MSVPKGKRNESKVEFDNTYCQLYKDAVRLINCQFGASEKVRESYTLYIQEMSRKILDLVVEIGKHIRIANSIYPQTRMEYETRRTEQGIAIGLCFDLLTQYQLIMYTLGAKDNKYVNEAKTLIKEINCLKKWRTSDNRFKDLQ